MLVVVPASVLVVDDHRALAEALAERLRSEPDFGPVTAACSFGAAMAALSRNAFDVVITDIELGPDDGIELIARLREQHREAVAVVLTMHDDVVTAFESIRAGAQAFVSKDVASPDLLAAIRSAVRGETYISPDLLTGVIEGFRNPNALRTDVEQRMSRLTEREWEVLVRLVHGKDRSTIAGELYLSLNTVRTHVKNILAKLEVHSTLEAVAVALRARSTRLPQS